MVSQAGFGQYPTCPHVGDQPAYLETIHKLSEVHHQAEIQMPKESWSFNDQQHLPIAKRGVPFLPGNLFCPEVTSQIVNGGVGTDCSIYNNDPSDLNPDVGAFYNFQTVTMLIFTSSNWMTDSLREMLCRESSTVTLQCSMQLDLAMQRLSFALIPLYPRAGHLLSDRS